MFDTCKAWQSGEVYLEMAYNAYYTNFETVLCNTWFIAKSVYPEAFADIDLTQKTDEVTEMFLGTGLAEEIFACPSSFGGYQKIDTASFFR
jgi:iron complex transport system substrate-binding protein